MKKFEVNIYYSSFCTYEVEAENMDEAIKRARKININENDILTNLENWEEANTAAKIV